MVDTKLVEADAKGLHEVRIMFHSLDDPSKNNEPWGAFFYAHISAVVRIFFTSKIEMGPFL